jgi:Arc/MetJ family transcription regulator
MKEEVKDYSFNINRACDMATVPYNSCMKMTLHIDDGLLDRVMAATGAASKTAAVDLALREIDRRSELKRLATKGLGLSAAELREAFDPNYDLNAMRKTETRVKYGRGHRSGR